MMKTLSRFAFPLAVLFVALIVAVLIMRNPPALDHDSNGHTAVLNVEAVSVQLQPYQVEVASYGTVQPRTQSTLLAQVSGQIVWVSEQFREGGFFEQGDVLLRLDDRDYQADLNIARAKLLSAKQALQEEQARGEQAREDWLRLGDGEQAGGLVLRQPQLEVARAQVLSAQASLDKAKLAVERTEITVPYAGRILTKQVDLGQLVSSNSALATIYAVDYVEVRLPINNHDLALIQLPEEYRGSDETAHYPQVLFTSELIGEQAWQGRIVRTEGAIDGATQQLYVVAQIDNPYRVENPQQAPLKIGQYLEARIQGRKLDGALKIPSQAIYHDEYVYVVAQGLLQRRDIQIRWQNGEDVLLSTGLDVGDQVVVTPLGQVSSGTSVVTELIDLSPLQASSVQKNSVQENSAQENSVQENRANESDNSPEPQLTASQTQQGAAR